MNILYLYFSPTGGTKRAADIIVRALGEDHTITEVDLCRTETPDITLSADYIAVIALPSYYGRVPVLAARRLRHIKGNGARAVLLCVYGNRAFDDTLLEMKDLAEEISCKPVAAAAAIAEHSIYRCFAAGRPNAEDEKILQSFGKRIRDKLESGDDTPVNLPGNRPYKEIPDHGMIPHPTEECTNCGLCAAECPNHAIDEADASVIDENSCISCMRCIAVCPIDARINDPKAYEAGIEKLRALLTEPKKAELFV